MAKKPPSKRTLRKLYTKLCKGCDTRLPLDDFGTDRSTMDKKAYKCILCMRKYYADKKKLMKSLTDNT